VPSGRLRVALGVALAVALVAAGVAVVERQRRTSLEERVARLEERRRAEERAAAQSERRERGEDAPAEEDEGPEGLVGRLLEGVLGPGSGLFSSSALEQCATAFGAVSGASGGLGGLVGGGSGASGGQAGDAAGQMRAVAEDLEAIRDLEFRRLPDPVFLPREQLRDRVRAEVAEELTDEVAARQARGLVALGALPPGSDLRELTLRAVGDQVAGFYDPETGEMVVGRATTGPLDGATRMILAHELDHALTDQVLDLPLAPERPAPGAEDTALAQLALIEGDATLAMQLYALRHVGLLEQLSGLGSAAGAQQQLTALPHHLRSTLTFPYLQGLAFVCRLHAGGGWKAVDRAYDEPPTTTAQVLFPERYDEREAAVDPRDPAAPGRTWRAEPRRAVGAAELVWLLEAPGGDAGRALDDATGRARAWAGGELHQWSDGGRTAAALVLVERDGAPAPLCATVTAWYRSAFPDARPAAAEPGEALVADGAGQDAVLRCDGRDVRLGLAPDVATARALSR